jgi:uncharacterized protein YbjT (DUF2867 family)
MAKVLVTGASGFIGQRVVFELLKEGHTVYALKRKKTNDSFLDFGANYIELEGDVSSLENLHDLPYDIDASYYFLHSLGFFSKDLTEQEKRVAQNFLKLIEKTTCKQIIYLAGIVEQKNELSEHLKSRHAVEEVLKTSFIPLTVLRSSIIIGSGSASFEIIRDLCEKLPFMVAPKWVESFCQPIAIKDVLYYLIQSLLNPLCFNKTYDIAGPEPVTFKQLLLRYSKFRNLKRFILNVPVLTPRLSSYWLYFITSVNFSICSYLVDSMKHSTRKLNDLIDKDIPLKTLTIEEALDLVFQDVEQNPAISTLAKGSFKETSIPLKEFEPPKIGCFEVTIKTLLPEGNVFFDEFVKNCVDLEKKELINIIFEDKANKILLVKFNDYKSFGSLWFFIKQEKNQQFFKEKFIFRPTGLKGRLYWYYLKYFQLSKLRKAIKFN